MVEIACKSLELATPSKSDAALAQCVTKTVFVGAATSYVCTFSAAGVVRRSCDMAVGTYLLVALVSWYVYFHLHLLYM